MRRILNRQNRSKKWYILTRKRLIDKRKSSRYNKAQRQGRFQYGWRSPFINIYRSAWGAADITIDEENKNLEETLQSIVDSLELDSEDAE